MLGGPIGFLGKEAAVDRARLLGAAIFVRFGRGRRYIVAHVLAKLLHPPTEGLGVELGHAVAVFIRHLKVDDGIHRYVLHVAKKGANELRTSCAKLSSAQCEDRAARKAYAATP